jgi:DNA-binding transcriptional MerR regulator
MGKYKISDSESLYWTNPQTSRAWEQRHSILAPLRKESNIPYYEAEQLKQFLN